LAHDFFSLCDELGENTEWKNTAEEAGSAILLHSWERMRRAKTPYLPKRKAYMALAVAVDEAIKAFIALDESLLWVSVRVKYFLFCKFNIIF
jgi:hypothetical protein